MLENSVLHTKDPHRQPAPVHTSIGRACVLGGSFAGLLAARVLADHSQRVVILEPDAPTGPFERAFVPQGKHGHFLQPDGLTLLEGWFPGFTREARAHGAVLAVPGRQQLFVDGMPVDFPESTMLVASRPFIEHEIRRRVTALPNVEVLQARATGLRYRDEAVSAVSYRSSSGSEHILDVELAVDAMGRASRMGRWLEGDGYPAPVIERVPIGLSYTTRLFDRPAEPREPLIACALNRISLPPNDVPHSRTATALAGIAVYAIERSRWQVVTMTYGLSQHATTRDDVSAVAAASPEVFGQAMTGDPVGEPATFYYRESHRRLLTQPEDHPTGLLFIGDTVASLNPIRGEGMWSATQQAALLAAHLLSTDEPAAGSRRFTHLLSAFIDQTWNAEIES